MEYFLYFIPQARNEQWVNANMTQNILVTTQSYLFFLKKTKQSTKTIFLKYLILIIVIIFFVKL